MRKVYATVFTLLAGFGIAAAADGVITLDLTKAVTELEFNADNGSWTGTYNDEEEVIESQSFIFIHNSMGDYDTWWGFSASNHADNSRPENTLTQQWSAMAKGGIELDENGDVKLDDFGAPVVSDKVPYLVGYYNAYMSARPVDMIFNDGLAHEPVGMYVCLNSYAYYSIQDGDAYTRPFTNGDSFTLTVHGIADDESEKTIDVVLGSYTNGDLTLSRGWKYVDLSSLGAVNEIYFTMDSTDKGAWGMNTPGYFCLDKLSVKEAEDISTGIDSAYANVALSYDRATSTLSVAGTDFAMVTDALGRMVISGESSSFDLSSLPAGVYIAKAANKSLKFAK